MIGCGEHALRSHALPAQKIRGLTLVGVCDPNETSLDVFVGALDHAVIPMSEEEALGDPNIDAVVIASPDRFHAGSLLRAVQAGKHVLCEKPLDVEFDELEQFKTSLIEADSRGLVVTSCHPRRMDPPYMWIQFMIPMLRHRFGSVLSISLDFSYHRPSKVGLHKGLLIDHINHELDTVNFLLGYNPTWMRQVCDSETHYQAVGCRQDGVMLIFEGTRRLNEITYPEFVRIRFERGDIWCDCNYGVVTINDHDTGELETNETLMPCTDYETRFLRVMQNFVDTIRGEGSNYLSPRDLIDNTSIGVTLSEQPLWDPHDLLH